VLRNDSRSKLIWLSLSLVLLLSSGCGTFSLKNYGDMRPKSAVMASFENYEAIPNLEYYISGPDSGPTALIGIDKSYVFEDELWRRIDDPANALKEVVRNMQWKASEYNLNLFGFDIRDNQGKDIGDWYAILDSMMPVKIIGEKHVTVYPPPNDIYERYRFRIHDTDD